MKQLKAKKARVKESRRRQIALVEDSEFVMLKAAENLKNTFWFGILEDIDRSYELLQFQLGLKIPIMLKNKNSGSTREHYINDKKMSEKHREFLKKLLPMDLWLYEYGLKLFEARWTFYKKGEYIDPDLPDFPDLTCLTTSLAFRCGDVYASLDICEERQALQGDPSLKKLCLA